MPFIILTILIPISVALLLPAITSHAVPFLLETGAYRSGLISSENETGHRYIGQELDLTNHNDGMYPLGSTQSHSRPLPFPWQNASNSSTDYAKLAQTSSERDSLGSDGVLLWSLSNSNGSVVVPALFPSQVHLDLIRAGVIDDPNGNPTSFLFMANL